MSKIENKRLPFNMKPNIRTFSYYAYEVGIISATEYIGKDVVDFVIHDYEEAEWSCYNVEGILKNKGGKIVLEAANKYNQNLNGCIYRELKNKDYIHLSIPYMQYTHPWGAINLFISDLSESEIMKDDYYLCRLGKFCHDGVYCRIDNTPVYSERKKFFENCELLLYRDDDRIEAYTNDEDGNRRLIYCSRKEFDNKKSLKIGVQYKLLFNTYYNWYTTNFIQLSCDLEDDERKLEYFHGSPKNWDYHNSNYFLDYSQIDLKYMIKRNINDFFRNAINEENYVELWIDHYFVNGFEEYQNTHYWHPCLIIGYNDIGKYDLVGYSTNGYIQTGKISFRDLRHLLNREKASENKMWLISYQQDWIPYEFSWKRICKLLKQYCEGENSSASLITMSYNNRIYGVGIYTELLSQDGIFDMLHDKRIAYLLFEHKKYLRECIDYWAYKMRKEQNIVAIIPRMDELVLLSRGILLAILKYQETLDSSVIEYVRGTLEKLREKEISVINDLISVLDVETARA